MEQLLGLALFLVAIFLFARWFVGVGIGAPWLPVRAQDIEAAFRLVDVGPEDVVIDLGSGDGRLLIEAAKRGAHVVGYELNPFMAWLSRARLKPFKDRAEIHRKNLLKADLSRATVIFIFGMGTIMPAVAEKLRREARPAVRIVSFAFEMPGWTYEEKDGIALKYRPTFAGRGTDVPRLP
ncbi:MAG: class I SAM-dependent methyltransferase [Candidatus Uhrbacteria bacterium]|nr:class I SAM-dependent methyltransferase [Candidatus Uhrbacteria bacterium]